MTRPPRVTPPGPAASRIGVLVAAVAVGGLPAPAAGQGGPSARDVVRQTSQHFAEYESFAAHLQGAGTTTITRLSATGQPVPVPNNDDQTFRLRQNERCCSLEYQFPRKKRPMFFLLAANERYAFRLDRKTADGQWAISGVDAEKKDGSNLHVAPVPTEARAIRLAAVRVENCPVTALLTAERVTAVAPAEQDGRPLVRVTVSNPHPAADNAECRVQAGAVLLDPARAWCVAGYDITFPTDDGQVRVVETRTFEDQAGFPVPKRFERRQFDAKGEAARIKFVTEYQLQYAADLPPDGDFTLKAYDLPEPFAVTEASRPTRWYLWALAAAVGLIATGFFFRRLRAATPT